MNNATPVVDDESTSSNDRGKFVALLSGVLLLVVWFWSGPIVTIGFDPQLQRCLPDLHLALLVHAAPRTVHDGDLLFWKPAGALARFREQFILKEVAGVPGDHVTIRGGKVQINGKTVVQGFPLARFYQRAVNGFDRDEIIPPGEFFMVGVHPLSNDSRYWGYLDAGKVSGSAYKIF